MQINKTSIIIQKNSITHPIKLSKITNPNGSLYLSQAPGKKIVTGRNGLKYDRNLKDDLTEIRNTAKIQTIICLLNKYELRTIGVDLTEYEKICKFLSIELLVINKILDILYIFFNRFFRLLRWVYLKLIRFHLLIK